MNKAIIFSAPSGSGKTTIVQRLLDNNKDLAFSISACTRDKRGRNEVNGKDYYFLSPSEFKTKIDNEEFIEWEEVYAGNFYGTLKSEVDRIWKSGNNVVFDLDVRGALNLKKYFGKNALAIFVKAPTFEELARRLKNRQTESAESYSQRLFKAKFELTFEHEFDTVILNDSLEKSVTEAQKLYDQFKQK